MKLKIILLMLLSSTLIISQNQINKKIAVTIDDLPIQHIKPLDNKQNHELMDKLLEKIRFQNAPVIGFVNENKLQVEGISDESKIELLRKWLNA